jgi:lipopolysaccharide export system protein LptA
MKRLVLFVAVAFWPAMSAAQPIDLSGGGPVEITSLGGLEVRDQEQVAIASGDARATRGNVTVLADRLVARYRRKADPAGAGPVAPAKGSEDPTNPENGGKEVYRLEAHGHVRILTETDEAVGDDAIYDIDQAVLILTGKNLKLTTPQQVLTARDSMEYWSALHMAVGRGNAVVVTTDQRRLAADILVAYTTAADDPKAAPAAANNPKAAPAAANNPKAAPAAAGPGDPALDSGKLKRIDAFGNVEVRSPVDIVRGDRGSYIPATEIARVVDHVRVTHLGSQVNGAAADINMKTGIARIAASAGSRVQGLIVPKDTRDVQGKTDPPGQQGKPAKP